MSIKKAVTTCLLALTSHGSTNANVLLGAVHHHGDHRQAIPL
ncbi:MAG: hypothetical protein OXF67_03430 [Cyanobacteria bacterium MAG CAR4_bin_6]|nr:hypothetical protein [Cyanobacteria bacterium MAG CAR4_bin_6]